MGFIGLANIKEYIKRMQWKRCGFSHLGSRSIISLGCKIRNARSIYVGDGVYIDRGCIFGKKRPN